MTTPASTPSPVLRVAVATLAGAAVALSAFAAGWYLLAGAVPPLLGWAVGGVAAAFVGSEVGCRAAVRLTDDLPPPDQQPHPSPRVSPSDPDDTPVGSIWRDRVRVVPPTHDGRRR